MNNERWRKYWAKFLKSCKDDRIRNLCREWLESPDNIDAFSRFFETMWQIIDVTKRGQREKIQLLGGSGKARVLSGKAFQDFCYNFLKNKFQLLQFKRDEYVMERYSMKPDISIWKEDLLLAVLEFKIGHDFQQLRTVAMEGYLLRSELGRNISILFLTREKGRNYFEKPKTRREYDKLKQFVEPFYFSIDQPNCRGLNKEMNLLIDSLRSLVSYV